MASILIKICFLYRTKIRRQNTVVINKQRVPRQNRRNWRESVQGGANKGVYLPPPGTPSRNLLFWVHWSQNFCERCKSVWSFKKCSFQWFSHKRHKIYWPQNCVNLWKLRIFDPSKVFQLKIRWIWSNNLKSFVGSALACRLLENKIFKDLHTYGTKNDRSNNRVIFTVCEILQPTTS